MRAVIIGAGIAGLSAAKGLRLLGWDVEIYEQAPELKPLGAGLSLSANALGALRSLGLYEAVAAVAQPIHQVDLLDDKGNVLQSTDFRRFDRKYEHLSMAVLHCGDLHQALLSRLPDSAVRTGMECVDAPQTRDHVHLTFADGQIIEAELVLACDGIHSSIRKAVFPESRERFVRYTCWRAIAPGIPVEMDPAHLTESWGAGKRFGLAAIPGNKIYWFACCGADRMNDPALAKADLGSLQDMFADFHDPIPEVLSKTRPDALIWTDIVDVGRNESRQGHVPARPELDNAAGLVRAALQLGRETPDHARHQQQPAPGDLRSSTRKVMPSCLRPELSVRNRPRRNRRSSCAGFRPGSQPSPTPESRVLAAADRDRGHDSKEAFTVRGGGLGTGWDSKLD